MKLIKNEKPKLKMPKFLCDEKLSPHLDDDPLLKHMNKSFICGLIGKAGSGKTSLMTSLILTKHKYKKVFSKIYVFMPSSSRASMKEDIFSVLPEEQIFEGVSSENLSTVYELLKENTEENKNSLLIFDDVQSHLKNNEVEKALLHIVSNRRHLKCSLFVLAQNWVKIPKQIRQVFSDTYLFNVSKAEYSAVFDEIINISKSDFVDVLEEYRKQKLDDSHSFLYIHNFDTIFINWDELVIDDGEIQI